MPHRQRPRFGRASHPTARTSDQGNGNHRHHSDSSIRRSSIGPRPAVVLSFAMHRWSCRSWSPLADSSHALRPSHKRLRHGRPERFRAMHPRTTLQRRCSASTGT